jgi:hypothetical protein
LLVCGAQNGKVPGPSGPPEGPNVFGRPDVSRYEEFYRDSGKGDAIEAEAKVVGDQTEQATNPFFVGYEVEELAMLWDVHTANYGERADDKSDENLSMKETKIPQDTDGGFKMDALPVGGGSNQPKIGLHELILEACREADEEKSKRHPT